MVVVSTVETCHSPYCDDPRAEDRKFCGFHSALFDRLREEDTARRKAVRDQIGRKGRSTCCRPGCQEPRMRTENYCAECHSDGYREEDYE